MINNLKTLHAAICPCADVIIDFDVCRRWLWLWPAEKLMELTRVSDFRRGCAFLSF